MYWSLPCRADAHDSLLMARFHPRATTKGEGQPHTCTAAGFVLGRRNRSANANLKQRSFATSDPTMPKGTHSFDPEQILRPIASTIAAARSRREAKYLTGSQAEAWWWDCQMARVHTPPTQASIVLKNCVVHRRTSSRDGSAGEIMMSEFPTAVCLVFCCTNRLASHQGQCGCSHDRPPLYARSLRKKSAPPGLGASEAETRVGAR